jgi:hypothetical protein
MRHASALPLAAVLGLALLGGCSGSDAPPALEGALTPGIPIYAPSKVSGERHGFRTGGDISDPTHSGFIWKLVTSDSPEQVMAFYRKEPAPGWKREDYYKDGKDAERDSMTWEFTPPDAPDDYTRVQVSVQKAQKDGKTEFSISEVVSKYKRGEY